ncbi:MAG: hypothetical protein R2824_09765 [Saprospiraceae bacterium]|nr:hypothetical protein [Lewinella sp.]
MSAPVPNQVTESETSETTILLGNYIKTATFGYLEIIVVDSEAPVKTRQQLRKSFGGNSFQHGLLISSSTQLSRIMNRLEQQLATKKNKNVVLPLVLLAPSTWPNFHELMLDIQEMFVGPIFLVDNSQAAANWADQVIFVDSKGKLKKSPLAVSNLQCNKAEQQ